MESVTFSPSLLCARSLNGGPFNVSISRLKGVRPLTGETPGSYSAPAAFGRFQVLHQIGAGVLGPVFLARDADRHSVAIKVFRLDVTPEQAAELASQLNALARANLSHPAIVAPTAAGIEGTVAYLVEDYVGADSLDAAIRQYGPAPAGQAIRILASVAGALDFAAAVNVHHGALHLRDVLVSPEDVRLTGLGVGRALEAIGLRAPVRRPYTAPERAQREAWDARADVYSLGVLARELLVPRGRGGEAESEPRIPDEQAALLVPVLARATSARPSDRFAGALDLVSAIQAALSGRAPAPQVRAKAEARAAAVARASELMLPLDDSREAEREPSPGTVAPAAAEMVGPEAVPPSDIERPAEETSLAPDFDAFRVTEAPADRPVEGAGDLRIDIGNVEEPGAASGTQAPDVEIRELSRVVPELPRFTDVVATPAERKPEPPPPAERARVSRHSPLELGLRPPAGSTRPEARQPLDADFAAPVVDTVEGAARDPLEQRAGPSDEIRLQPDRAREDLPIATPDAPPSPRVSTIFGDAVPPERERSGALPFVLVLLVGLVLGAIGGYYVGAGRSTAPSAKPPAAAAPISTAPSPESSAVSPAAPGGGGVQQGAAKTQPPANAATQPPAAVKPLPTPPSAPPASAKVVGSLTVNSSPRGAAVAVNGKRRGVTPLRIRNLAPGRYTIRVSRSGYTAEERQVTLTPERPTSTVAVTLSRTAADRTSRSSYSGSLSVESSPPGARIFLDGKGVGTTPAVIQNVAVGSHVVRVDMIGFRRWAQSVQVNAGERVRVTASLERESQ